MPEAGEKKKFNGLLVPHGWGGLTITAEGKKEQSMSYMDSSRQRESLCRETPVLLKPSALVRLIHYHKNSIGKTLPHDSITSHWVPPMGLSDAICQMKPFD